MAYKKPNLGSRSSYLSKHLGRIFVCLLAFLIFNTSPAFGPSLPVDSGTGDRRQRSGDRRRQGDDYE